jgi:hypothetical protein
MPTWRATFIALAVALAFFNAAMMFKPWIIIGTVVVVTFLGFRWLCRHHPMVAVALIGFLRGLLSR